jgi:hypothetical protein
MNSRVVASLWARSVCGDVRRCRRAVEIGGEDTPGASLGRLHDISRCIAGRLVGLRCVARCLNSSAHVVCWICWRFVYFYWVFFALTSSQGFEYLTTKYVINTFYITGFSVLCQPYIALLYIAFIYSSYLMDYNSFFHSHGVVIQTCGSKTVDSITVLVLWLSLYGELQCILRLIMSPPCAFRR